MCSSCPPSAGSPVRPNSARVLAAAAPRPASVKSAPIPRIPKSPRILTTTVGSYPVPDWLAALPSEQAVIDATRVIFDLQRQAGIDLPTDGELYRFDVNHPDTNGMIEYFIRPMAGITGVVGRSVTEEFSRHHPMG
ncbi:MAG TPA: hypothetical protein PLG56_01145, partial [Lacunisphaera sp.]|nr:hypothetical protein [Lacunisphaera sp.]